jgi:hypothetical protein
MILSIKLSVYLSVIDLDPNDRANRENPRYGKTYLGVGDLRLNHIRRRVLETAYSVPAGCAAPPCYLPYPGVSGPVSSNKALKWKIKAAPSTCSAITNTSTLPV